MDYSADSLCVCVRNDKYRARAKRHSHAHELELLNCFHGHWFGLLLHRSTIQVPEEEVSLLQIPDPRT